VGNSSYLNGDVGIMDSLANKSSCQPFGFPSCVIAIRIA
jgi:hypothetical protein